MNISNTIYFLLLLLSSTYVYADEFYHYFNMSCNEQDHNVKFIHSVQDFSPLSKSEENNENSFNIFNEGSCTFDNNQSISIKLSGDPGHMGRCGGNPSEHISLIINNQKLLTKTYKPSCQQCSLIDSIFIDNNQVEIMQYKTIDDCYKGSKDLLYKEVFSFHTSNTDINVSSKISYLFLPYLKNFTDNTTDKKVSEIILDSFKQEYISTKEKMALDINVLQNTLHPLVYKEIFRKDGYNGPSILKTSSIPLSNDRNATLFIYEFWNSWRGARITAALSLKKDKQLLYNEIEKNDDKLEYSLDEFLLKNYTRFDRSIYKDIDTIFTYKNQTYIYRRRGYEYFSQLFRILDDGSTILVSRFQVLPNKEEIPKLPILYSLMYQLADLRWDPQHGRFSPEQHAELYFYNEVRPYLVRPWIVTEVLQNNTTTFSKEYDYLNHLFQGAILELSKFYNERHHISLDKANKLANHFISKTISHSLADIESRQNLNFTIEDINITEPKTIDCSLNYNHQFLQKSICSMPKKIIDLYNQTLKLERPYPMFSIVNKHQEFFVTYEKAWDDLVKNTCSNQAQENLKICLEYYLKQKIYFYQSIQTGGKTIWKTE